MHFEELHHRPKKHLLRLLIRILEHRPNQVQKYLKCQFGQDYQNADYIYTAFMSEVDTNVNDKYKIPSNFIKIDEFILDGIRVYEVFKRNK